MLMLMKELGVQMNGFPIAYRTRHEHLLSNQFDLCATRRQAPPSDQGRQIKGFAVTTKPGSRHA